MKELQLYKYFLL